MIAFWFRLLTGKQTKLSLLVNNLLLNDINNHVYNHRWIVVKSILDDAGYTYIWISQCEGITSASVFKQYINARLTDQYLQSWYTYIDNSSKASNYKLLLHSKHLSQCLRKNTGVLSYGLDFRTIISL